ncbi:MAG: hypothetical protein RL272_855 [Candidatus Parcubacteria bacterium]|jgi:uncharacterized protein YeaO (DUF488 family)
MVTIKRVYDQPRRGDGRRILVDRLWPRGLAKDRAKIDEWLREVAPSDGLRKWYGHDPERWPEFRKRYRRELRSNAAVLSLRESVRAHSRVCLLFAAADKERNNAVVLRDFLKN